MKTRIVYNVKVGKAKVKQTTPTHVAGTREGNKVPLLTRRKGFWKKRGGKEFRASASRSTGVNSLFRNSIVPGAPRLTPM